MNEYCDRCGAAAKSRIILTNGNDLNFCGHHTNAYRDSLLDIAAEIVLFDEEMVPA